MSVTSLRSFVQLYCLLAIVRQHTLSGDCASGHIFCRSLRYFLVNPPSVLRFMLMLRYRDSWLPMCDRINSALLCLFVLTENSPCSIYIIFDVPSPCSRCSHFCPAGVCHRHRRRLRSRGAPSVSWNPRFRCSRNHCSSWIWYGWRRREPCARRALWCNVGGDQLPGVRWTSIVR